MKKIISKKPKKDLKEKEKTIFKDKIPVNFKKGKLDNKDINTNDKGQNSVIIII